MSSILKIEGQGGNQTLSGDISVCGSKNAALIAFPSCILFSDEVCLENIPEIEDVHRMIELLQHIGVSVDKKSHGTYSVRVSKQITTDLDGEIVGSIRASVFLIAPLLARYGEITLPYPGGDNIGARPINLFIEGLKKMGAVCSEENNKYHFSLEGKKLQGAEIYLKLQSVGATQSLMLAGILAEGTTIIKNAAMEPEIIALADYLISCGAHITGVGTPTIKIEGGEELCTNGKVFTNIPDRIETGTFVILGILAGKDITIKNCNPQHVDALFAHISGAVSSEIKIQKNSIQIINNKPLTITPINIRTHEYPGFATDLQPPLMVLLTQAEGKSLVFETIFEERFNYVGNLIHMGAKIVTYDPHRVRVHGKTPLRGSINTSPDIRAGLAYVLAAIVAKGQSVIHNVYVIDRGYENIETRLQNIGVSIERIK